MRYSIVRTLLVLIALAACGIGAARSGEVPRLAPDTLVLPNGKTTYLDLARHFVPDIAQDGTSYSGHRHIRVRHVAGEDAEATDGDTFGIYDVSTFRFAVHGKARMLVLFDFAQVTQAAQGFAVLALYDLTAEPRLLDAADVGYDRWTGFFDDKLLALGDESQAVVTRSTHFNAGQSYATHALLLVKDDRIGEIDHITLLNDVNGTIYHDFAIAYSVKPRMDDQPATIDASVTETIRLVEEVCQGFDTCSMASKTIDQDYRWDAAQGKYRPDSDAFEKLNIETENRL